MDEAWIDADVAVPLVMVTVVVVVDRVEVEVAVEVVFTEVVFVEVVVAARTGAYRRVGVGFPLLVVLELDTASTFPFLSTKSIPTPFSSIILALLLSPCLRSVIPQDAGDSF